MLIFPKHDIQCPKVRFLISIFQVSNVFKCLLPVSRVTSYAHWYNQHLHTCYLERHDSVYNRAGSKKTYMEEKLGRFIVYRCTGRTSAKKSHLRNNDKTWVFDKSKRVQGAIYVINCDKTLRTFDNTRECKKHDPHFPCVLKYS